MTPVLDLYILAKLDQGLETPYDLQREAALSLGAIVPALRRLSARKLVTKAEGVTATRRPRHCYRLTKAGKDAVESGWKGLLNEDDIPSDLDALLRLVDVAQQYGAKKSRLIKFLRAAAERRISLAVRLTGAVGIKPGEPFSYRNTRVKVEIERLQAEERALTAIADSAAAQRVKRESEGSEKSSPSGVQRTFFDPMPDVLTNPSKPSE